MATPSRFVPLLALAACAGAGPVDWDGAPAFSDDELAYLTYTDGAYDTIRVVDASTGESRELTDLDGGEGFGLTSAAMSPDRRSVAFSAYFRLDGDDVSPAGGLPHPGIWRVGEGDRYEEIAPPLQQMDSGTSCSSDTACAPLGMECNLVFGTCQLEAATFLTDDLAFDPAGDELWFTYGTYWLDGYYLAGGTTLASVPSNYGETTAPKVHPNDSSCTQVSDVAVDPSGDGLLALRSVCLDGSDEGVFRYDLPGLDATRAIPTPEGFSISLTNPDWYPDGHGFVFVVYGAWDEDGDGVGDWYADGLVQYDAETDEVSLISAMPEGYSILDPSISPDGDRIAMCVSGGGGSDLYLVDLVA
jgi:Tol biopolymer transport system component